MELTFVDDINLFLSHKNIDTLFDNMNVELPNVSTWFKLNKVSLNVDKTKWLLFFFYFIYLYLTTNSTKLQFVKKKKKKRD